jgi:hypothetical protein
VKAHRTDLLSLAFGLVFLALSAWWLLAQLLGLALPPVGWFLAGALILIGVLGLVGALRSGRSAGPTAPADTPVDPTSGAGLPPTSGTGLSTSTAVLPAWDAESTAWDAPTTGTDPDTATTDAIHPAWLAHSSTPQTAPTSGAATSEAAPQTGPPSSAATSEAATAEWPSGDAEPTADIAGGDRPTEALPPVSAEPAGAGSADEGDGPRRDH